MKKIKRLVVISSVIVFVSLTALIVTFIVSPKLETNLEFQKDYVNEQKINMREENSLIWSNKDAVASHLNNLELSYDDGSPAYFEYVEVTVLRRIYEREYSAMIRYEDEEYVFKIKDPGTYESYEGPFYDYYTYGYFTVNDELFYSNTNNIFYADNDPDYLFENSNSEIDSFVESYKENNINPIIFWINFIKVLKPTTIFLMIVLVPVLIINTRKMYLYSGFSTVQEAEEYYKEYGYLRKKKKVKKKEEHKKKKYNKALEELDKLKNEVSE